MKDLAQLIEDLREDEGLRDSLASAEDRTHVDVVLADAGYAVTAADLAAAIVRSRGDISDEELDAAAGGTGTTDPEIREFVNFDALNPETSFACNVSAELDVATQAELAGGTAEI